MVPREPNGIREEQHPENASWKSKQNAPTQEILMRVTSDYFVLW